MARESESALFRMRRLEDRIRKLTTEYHRLVSDVRNLRDSDAQRERFAMLMRAGLLIEKAGLLDECQSADFIKYLKNYKRS